MCLVRIQHRRLPDWRYLLCAVGALWLGGSRAWAQAGEMLPTPGPPLAINSGRSLVTVNDSTALLLRAGELYRTTDWGRTWQRQPCLPAPHGYGRVVRFLPGNGPLLRAWTEEYDSLTQQQAPRLRTSADGGRTWSAPQPRRGPGCLSWRGNELRGGSWAAVRFHWSRALLVPLSGSPPEV